MIQYMDTRKINIITTKNNLLTCQIEYTRFYNLCIHEQIINQVLDLHDPPPAKKDYFNA